MLGTFDLTVFILSQSSQHLTPSLMFFVMINIHVFLISNQNAEGLTLKMV